MCQKTPSLLTRKSKNVKSCREKINFKKAFHVVFLEKNGIIVKLQKSRKVGTFNAEIFYNNLEHIINNTRVWSAWNGAIFYMHILSNSLQYHCSIRMDIKNKHEKDRELFPIFFKKIKK